jgi:hypothetical protein
MGMLTARIGIKQMPKVITQKIKMEVIARALTPGIIAATMGTITTRSTVASILTTGHMLLGIIPATVGMSKVIMQMRAHLRRSSVT